MYLKQWPKNVAEDSVLHTWRSYSQSLHNVIENQAVEQSLKRLKVPTTLIYGDKESQIVLGNVRLLSNLPANVKILMLEGTHNLPFEKQTELLQLIK